MWIQEWIDKRFGVPNTVNKQVYEDFAKEVERRERERIAILIKAELLDRMEQEYLIRQNDGDISSMAVIKMLESRAKCIWQTLKEESNG